MRTVQPDMTTVMDGWSAWVELNVFRPWNEFDGSSSPEDDADLHETLRPTRDSPDENEETEALEETEPFDGDSDSTEEVVVKVSAISLADKVSDTDSIITSQGNMPSMALETDTETEMENSAGLLDLVK